MSPFAPRRMCATPGCAARIPLGQTRCAPHAQARQRAYDAGRRSDPFRAFYWSAEWRRVRAAYLADHPRCQEPGCVEFSTEVDHQLPLKEGGAPFDTANLNHYCKRHSSAKSARRGERWGIRR